MDLVPQHLLNRLDGEQVPPLLLHMEQPHVVMNPAQATLVEWMTTQINFAILKKCNLRNVEVVILLVARLQKLVLLLRTQEVAHSSTSQTKMDILAIAALMVLTILTPVHMVIDHSLFTRSTKRVEVHVLLIQIHGPLSHR